MNNAYVKTSMIFFSVHFKILVSVFTWKAQTDMYFCSLQILVLKNLIYPKKAFWVKILLEGIFAQLYMKFTLILVDCCSYTWAGFT